LIAIDISTAGVQTFEMHNEALISIDIDILNAGER
jgi:hypothetical protein